MARPFNTATISIHSDIVGVVEIELDAKEIKETSAPSVWNKRVTLDNGKWIKISGVCAENGNPVIDNDETDTSTIPLQAQLFDKGNLIETIDDIDITNIDYHG